MAFLRYQTVRNIGLGVVGAGAVTAIVVLASGSSSESPPALAPAALSEASIVVRADAPNEPYATELQTVAQTMLEKRAESAKIKDLFRGNGPKVNLYDDNSDGQWDRAKIDYDRDEVDDEKLTFKSGHLERKSEKTGLIQVYTAGAWRSKP